jgi:hypothetical protein
MTTEAAAAAAAAAEVATMDTRMQVQQEAPRLNTISFAVALPAAVWSSWDEPETTRSLSLPGDERGIVGTIVFIQKSVMIWFGWGQLVPLPDGMDSNTDATTSTDAIPTSMTRSVGQGTLQSAELAVKNNCWYFVYNTKLD